MGCGSSGTHVEPFRNPKENTGYTQQTHSRKSSASSVRSKTDNKHKPRRKSTSSSSSSSSADSKRSKEKRGDGRSDTPSTKKTYTITRPSSDINDNPVTPLGTKTSTDEHVEKIQETNILKFDDNDEQAPTDSDVKSDIKTKEVTNDFTNANEEYEVLQKQTFLTGERDDEERTDTRITDNKDRQELHEVLAKTKEEKRTNCDFDKLEEEHIKELELVPLQIPAMDGNLDKKEYTIDDIVKHNEEVVTKDWFKYGKNVYSWTKMLPVIQARIDQYAQKVFNISSANVSGYPVYVARGNGVTRKEMAQLFPVCHVGTCVDVPRDQYLSRMKQSVESVLEEKRESEYFRDYADQLERWLASYPMNNIYNEKPKEATDPNEQAFPLPADILSDPSVLRKWTEDWKPFDLEVPEDGAWKMLPVDTTDLGDTHEIFANCLRSTGESMAPFDMTIDGEVAWCEIELDLLKNDKTTEAQEAIWKKREMRTNLNNPAWMAKRREELARQLKARYEKMQKPYPVEEYKNFAEILEQHWKAFLELCEKEFVPPKRIERRAASSNLKTGYKADDIDSADDTDKHGDELEKNNTNIKADVLTLERESSAKKRTGSAGHDDKHTSENVDRLDLDAMRENTGEDLEKLEKADSGLELDGVDDQGPNNTARTDDDRDSIQLTGRQEAADGVMRRA